MDVMRPVFLCGFVLEEQIEEADSLAPMGFLQNTFSVCVGIGCGIYIAQNYDVPNMKKLMRDWMGKAKEVEESYKKPGGSKN
uniref:Uncharacterized protein n=1 Tax=Oryza nivara TaxID=4536 RepID=A0A0E0H8Q5_ORYNI